jgi:hypothetical protein
MTPFWKFARKKALPASPPLPILFEGFVEEIAPGMVRGWCYDPSSADRPTSVRIVVDGKVVASVIADRFRPDLVAAGIGNGCHAFVVNCDAVAPSLIVEVVPDGAPDPLPRVAISGSPGQRAFDRQLERLRVTSPFYRFIPLDIRA